MLPWKPSSSEPVDDVCFSCFVGRFVVVVVAAAVSADVTVVAAAVVAAAVMDCHEQGKQQVKAAAKCRSSLQQL